MPPPIHRARRSASFPGRAGDGRTVPRRRALAGALGLAGLLALGGAPPPAAAQQPDGLRIGVSVGGMCLLGVNLEVIRDGRSADLTVGTWSFRDLSISLVGKQYLGASALKPMVGAGLWAVVARPVGSDRTGVALVARAPVGFDWHMAGDHNLVGALNVNRGLWVRRSNAGDERPMNRRLVPLPGLTYLWRP